MDQRSAFFDTLSLCKTRIPSYMLDYGRDGCTLKHAISMGERIDHSFSEAKIGRWLGWLQGSMAAQGYLTLEEAKKINKKWAD